MIITPPLAPTAKKSCSNRAAQGFWSCIVSPSTPTDSSAVQLTYDGAVNKGAPNWSPDGQNIVYYTNPGESFGQDIYIVSAAGGTPRPLGRIVQQ